MQNIRLVAVIIFSLFYLVGNAQFPTSIELQTVDGKNVILSDQLNPNKDELTVVVFWASFAPPMRNALNALQQIKNDGCEIQIVAIGTMEDERRVKGWLPLAERNGWDFTLLKDEDSKVFKQVQSKLDNPELIPHTYVIDSKGNILLSHNGYQKATYPVNEIIDLICK